MLTLPRRQAGQGHGARPPPPGARLTKIRKSLDSLQDMCDVP